MSRRRCIARGARPRVAVLREQGVNSQVEMAAAFDRAGFDAVDLHMTDVIERGAALDGFQVLVACGGFSYGDVLGAGEGWAKSILFNARARAEFERWFCTRGRPHARRLQRLPDARGAHRADPRNGCMAAIPCVTVPNSSRVACRKSRIADTPSPFFDGMAGSRLPIAVAHGEGRAEFRDAQQEAAARTLVTMRFVDGLGRTAHALSRQSERVARWHRRTDVGRRSSHDRDAASGTCVPVGAEFLAARGCRRGQRLDAPVQERAARARLTITRPGRVPASW